MYTLITAANSAQAHKLRNSLNSADVLLGDYLELPELMLKTGKMLRLPNPDTASYTHQMLSLCLDKDIDIIYPLREQELQLLLTSDQLFKEYNISIKVNGHEI